MKVLKTLKSLNNLSEISNQSTCSNKSGTSSKYLDDSFFYPADPKLGVRLSKSTNASLERREEDKLLPEESDSSEAKKRIDHFDRNPNGNLPMSKWIPDEYSKRCMKCRRAFDFFTRKHHCRKCGYLLCYSC